MMVKLQCDNRKRCGQRCPLNLGDTLLCHGQSTFTMTEETPLKKFNGRPLNLEDATPKKENDDPRKGRLQIPEKKRKNSGALSTSRTPGPEPQISPEKE